MQFLRADLADIVIAGGTEAPLSAGVLLAWDAMKIMSRTLCRPFAAGRDGLMLAEGAGVIVLETEHMLAVAGWIPGSRSRVSASAPMRAIAWPTWGWHDAAMALALADAGLGASDLAYINAHGTGTRANDRADPQAPIRLFAGRPSPPTSSIKGATGHALGAAGAFEAIATTMAIERGMVAPTANFDAPDPE